MTNFRINPETGEGPFWLLFIGAYFSLGFALIVMERLGLIGLFSDNFWLRLTEFVLLAVASLCVVMVIGALAAKLVIFLLSSAVALAAFLIDRIEVLFTSAVERARGLLLALLRLPLVPIYALHRAWIAPTAERRRQRAELRRLWEEVRAEYPTYEEFLRAFRGEAGTGEGTSDAGDREAGTPPPVDQFAMACATLGLPEDGTFTVATLKARYTELMKAVHPDVIGPNIFATQLNEARALIKARKGWK